ncbi:MAG TPA: lipopolysaccharide assembly protein LapB, partial [Casimicrobiaceae bacterium]|nr:lipopolysaccharide assembly protein LapB [Casimicrobiaceae bacterium]
MEFELWWLLPIVAVFFALGWIAARIDIKHLMRESRALPLSYFRGLNFLLNEQPDKAIESFIEVVKVDPQTIDLHFALGSLFRRQGEVDRAIRMHQNLLDRPDLAADKRTTATFELAQDFHRAGLLDRAEELFTKLNGTPFEHASLGHLISIYETEKDWPKAIAAMRRMEELAKQPYFKEIAQYHCELAQAALLRNDPVTVEKEIEHAIATHRACARANLIAGDFGAQNGDLNAAVAAWQRIESQNPAFLALAAERFADAYRKLDDRATGIRLLKNYQAQYPSLDILNALFTLVLEHDGPDAAATLIKDELARNPTLIGLDR